jgi:Chromo (CHRromatin Organisation MOdifier) domain
MLPLPAEVLVGDDEFGVKQGLDNCHVKSRGIYEYLVCWKRYSSEYDKWEPHAYLKNAPDVLKGYWA